MSTRRFELVEGASSKFWEVALEGASVTVRFGKIGTQGQSKTKEHASAAEAARELDALVREKTKKGYSEVGATASAEPSSGPSGELAALRADGQELLDLCGELTLLAPGAEPGLQSNFEAGVDGEIWARVFALAEWIGDEADGGAVGYWPRDGARVAVYLDNEGQFHLTGKTLIDHLAWRDFREEATELLLAFCEKHGLPVPADEAGRKAAVEGVETPEQRFAALKGAAEAKATAAASKKTSKPGKAPAAEKGPRPMCRNVASCVLSDGRVLVVTGEDFGTENVRRGVTIVFEPETLASRELPSLDLGGVYTPQGLVPLADGRARLLTPPRLFENDAWHPAPGDIAPYFDSGTELHTLRDGSFVVFGGGNSVQVHRIARDGTITRIGDLPEPRSYDRMVERSDGRLWFGGGEAKGETYVTATRRTVVLDRESGAFSPGPELPIRPHRGGLFAGTNDRALVLGTVGDKPGTSLWDGERWSAPREVPMLGTGVSELHVLPDGAIVSVRWTDGVIVRIDPRTLEASEIGTLRLGQSGARPHVISAGRILFLGGTLFQNREAEPEIWDPATGESRALPGWEKDVERQAKLVVKQREKEAARRTR